ncbi:MAG: N-acetyltransferase [Rhodobacteraceae bacterium]|nr:MAG: N-acetyltransferase [Paracoccaceae bacterium]
MTGRWCAVEPLDADAHAEDLFAANSADDAMWSYMGYGPFETLDAFRGWIADFASGPDPLFFAIRNEAGAPVGMASYLRIAPAAGAIEIGNLCFSPALQSTRAATEALTLLMGRAFALGYRRVEWKCNALNARSRRLAQRLGFSFEGVHRQAIVVKGRNRDTAWYSVIDGEWPALSAVFAEWLDPANFDAGGRQRARLSDMTRPLLSCEG